MRSASGGDLFEYSRLVFPLVPALDVLALAGIAEAARRLAARTRAAGIAEAARRLAARTRAAAHAPRLPALAAALAAATCALAAALAALVHAIPAQGTSPRVIECRPRPLSPRPLPRRHRRHGPDRRDRLLLAPPHHRSRQPHRARHRARRPLGPPELLTKQWIGHERNCTECVLARAPTVIATTMHRAEPWRTLDDTRAGFYADSLLLQEIKAGRAPYRVRDAEVLPGDHMLLFERVPGRSHPT